MILRPGGGFLRFRAAELCNNSAAFFIFLSSCPNFAVLAALREILSQIQEISRKVAKDVKENGEKKSDSLFTVTFFYKMRYNVY